MKEFQCVQLLSSILILSLVCIYLLKSAALLPDLKSKRTRVDGRAEGLINEPLSMYGNIALNTTLYVERCFGNCAHYVTPIGMCYNGLSMFNEKDNPFGDYDTFDEPIAKDAVGVFGIKRSFFNSTNSTCSGGITDSFDDIPVGKCVGPFGEPRPWGLLKIVDFLAVGNGEYLRWNLNSNVENKNKNRLL